MPLQIEDVLPLAPLQHGFLFHALYDEGEASAVSLLSAMFSYRLDRNKSRVARRREGRYLLRTNLAEHNPAKLRTYYLQLVVAEEAFKNLKSDPAVRPIFHQIKSASRRASSTPRSVLEVRRCR